MKIPGQISAEINSDLPDRIDRSRLVVVDHHGEAAGADRPSSLRQVYELVAPHTDAVWTRWRDLVAANDIGHVRSLRARGCPPDDIRKVRDADRAAQGVSPETEAESRRAAAARREGRLTIVETNAPTSSAIADFLLPEYGGPGADNLVVIMPDKTAVFARGSVVHALVHVPGCWYGGALPETGFWGAPRSAISPEQVLEIARAAL